MGEHEPETIAAVEQALAGGIPQRIGSYRFIFSTQRWEWSSEVEAIHGYPPGTARPTTEVVLSHRHPDDPDDLAATLRQIREDHRPFSTRHRIIAVDGHIREVVVFGEPLLDSAGRVVGTRGFYIDVTPAREDLISDAVTEIVDQRAVIEQAKGVLCVVYRIDPDTAFGLLRWRSQDTNTKLRDLADQLMTDFTAAGGEAVLRRELFDDLLMTAHLRLPGSAD